MEERVAFNRVHALELQTQLQNEFTKPEWRSAMQRAQERWKAEGGKVLHVRSATVARKLKAYWVD